MCCVYTLNPLIFRSCENGATMMHDKTQPYSHRENRHVSDVCKSDENTTRESSGGEESEGSFERQRGETGRDAHEWTRERGDGEAFSDLLEPSIMPRLHGAAAR